MRLVITGWGRGFQALQTGQDKVGKCITRFKEWELHNQVGKTSRGLGANKINPRPEPTAPRH